MGAHGQCLAVDTEAEGAAEGFVFQYSALGIPVATRSAEQTNAVTNVKNCQRLAITIEADIVLVKAGIVDQGFFRPGVAGTCKDDNRVTGSAAAVDDGQHRAIAAEAELSTKKIGNA